ncbi:MAG: sugar phosphate isomerase/epimerase [Planctomycetes bacterium]|jgi:sugar phosphate isomerase/epimerase|nr:sugar phosphate isomerase/epimerase [Planctomycetota bacterium]
MMKLGMHVDNWRHLDVSYQVPCQFAKDHGLEHVEFGTIDGDYFIQALGFSPHIPLHSDPLKLKAYLDSLGLQMSQLDAAYPMSCPEGLYRGIGYTLRAIQFAKAVGCPCVDTTDGARKPEGYADKEVMALMKQYYRVVLEWAERYEIIINVEPHGPYTTNPDTMEQILGFFDSPYLRMNLDTGNTFIAGQDPVKFLQRFRDKLSHCHIKDVSEALARAARGQETGIASSVVAIGEGVNADNIAGCIELLKKTKWDGILSIECEAAPGKVEQSIEWLRKQIGR